ncbi:putative ribonuclease H-like domain-containing protein, partial [Tanacetum coccineum]
EESIGAGHSSKETGSSQDCILMPLWKDGSLFDSSSKNASNDEPQPFSDVGKKDDGVRKESGIDNQERPKNSTQDINTAGPKVDMSNITTTYPVPSTPNTRIHKDHSLDHVIRDVQSGVFTRRMTKTSNEQGFISAVYEGKTHKDLHTCLFSCFLSQVEPKKVIQSLTDPRWIEAMQDELLQFKLQKVWTLVDLPYGKRAIRTKWVYKNKKDEICIVIRNKARLVVQGYTQEEEIDYDESAFLYGNIEEEFYVYQPPGFEDPKFHDRVYKSNKYVDEILKKFGFSTVKTASTPMETSKPLLKDAEAKDVDVHLYRSMIGSLMYLTASRPDIIFIDLPFDLEAHTDSDYAGASLDRKSITGGLCNSFIVGNKLKFSSSSSSSSSSNIYLTSSSVLNSLSSSSITYSTMSVSISSSSMSFSFTSSFPFTIPPRLRSHALVDESSTSSVSLFVLILEN